MADPAGGAYDEAGGDDHVFLSLTFRSQTAAQSGRRILYESGLRAQLRRAPPEISGLGCTWALYVDGADGVHAAQLLRAWNSPVSGVYRMHPNGYLEEAAL